MDATSFDSRIKVDAKIPPVASILSYHGLVTVPLALMATLVPQQACNFIKVARMQTISRLPRRSVRLNLKGGRSR